MNKGQDGINYNSLADNGILRHDREVDASDDIPVTSRGDKDVASRSCIFHRGNFISSHGSLERINRIDLRD
jgi:hypothetical protein